LSKSKEHYEKLKDFRGAEKKTPLFGGA